MTIDKTAAVANARQWANEMLAWKECGMAQRLMAKQILSEIGDPLFAVDHYDRLVKLRDQWRQRKKPADTFLWMIEQLENCLG